MEGFGKRLSPLHFLMSVMVVLSSSCLTLKILQSSIVLTLSDSGISSTSGVYPLFLLGDILPLKNGTDPTDGTNPTGGGGTDHGGDDYDPNGN